MHLNQFEKHSSHIQSYLEHLTLQLPFVSWFHQCSSKEVDLTINEAIAYNTNTMDAHRMVQWAKATYHDSKLIENLADDLFYAYFTENKELADHKVLLDVAKKNKLDTEEVKKILWHTLDELRKVQRRE